MPKTSKETMEELFKTMDFSFKSLHRGDVVEGKVLSVTGKEALVGLGAKAEGILPQREIKGFDIKAGDKLLVYVLTPEDKEGQILLSLKKAEGAKAWLQLSNAFEQGERLEAIVTGHNKGGLIVEVLGTQAFIPFSHLSSCPDPSLPRPELQSALDKMREARLSVKLIELNKEKDRIILSERDAVEEIEQTKRSKELKKFQVGQQVKGAIVSVMPYGLMIDVDGVEALVSQNELSWEEKTGNLASFEVGQQLTAKVLEIDEAGGKLKLSMKRLTADPWEKLTKKFKAKQKVKGEIRKITSFGVFVKITDGVEGLLPLSVLPKEKTDLTVGDKLDVVVKTIDKEGRRLELGMREKE